MMTHDTASAAKSGRLFNLFGLVMAGIVLSIIIVLVRWMFDDTMPFDPKGASIAGYDWSDSNVLWITRWGVRNRYCPGSSHRWVEAQTPSGDYRIEVQNNGIPFASAGAGGEERWYYPIFLPSHITGHMRFRVVMTYVCNPLQSVLNPLHTEMPTLEFDLPLKPERFFPPAAGEHVDPGIIQQIPYPGGPDRKGR